MPRVKRPLAEIDPNASMATSIAKKTKTRVDGCGSNNNEHLELTQSASHGGRKGRLIRRPGERWRSRDEYTRSELPVKEKTHVASNSKHNINYTTKDNSKLKTLLLDRGLPLTGSRKDLILRLEENSVIDYSNFTTDELTEMLKRRGVRNAAQGSKELKASRLRLNDELDRDTGNHEEGAMYGRLSAYEIILRDEMATLANRNATQEITKKLEILKTRLEALVGHTVDATSVMDAEDLYHARNGQIQNGGRRSSPIPVCPYAWSGSHWASRTDQELDEICCRRGMRGSGPKAAKIKWLDTGSVDYEDLYAYSLEYMCRNRGIHFKNGVKKASLVKLLRDDDAAS